MSPTISYSHKSTSRHATKYDSRSPGHHRDSTNISRKGLRRQGPFYKNVNRSHRKRESGSVRNAKGNRSLNLNRKRKTSVSSVSTVSSVSGIGENSDDEADSESSSDDEDDLLADSTPFYGRTVKKGRMTGSESLKSPLLHASKRLPSSFDAHQLDDDDSSDAVSSLDDDDVDVDEYDEDVDDGRDDDDNDSDENDDDDDDDGYGAVDDISDDDGEELDVEKLEEQMIMESEDERQTAVSLSSGSLAVAAKGEAWPALANWDDNAFFSMPSLFDENHVYTTLDSLGETDLTSVAVDTPVQRHVHFEETDSPSATDDDDELPGDFLNQDSLDPTLRRMIENDNDNLGDPNARFDDIFGELDHGHRANIYHVESDAISDGSSGYESMCKLLRKLIVFFSFLANYLLGEFQRMMVKRRTRISHLLLPLLIRSPSYAVILLLLWLEGRSLNQQLLRLHLLAVVGPSWAHLSLTRPFPWR
jgi:hypothetical protein